jgi:hypothetical protein
MLGIGVAIVTLGIAGLAYSMPMVSNEVASKRPIYKESDVPGYPSSILVYVAMEIASAAILTGGIALCASAQADRIAGPTPALSQTDTNTTEKMDDTEENLKKTASA